MKLKLYRESFNNEETIGSLYLSTDKSEEFLCFVLEDKVRETFGNRKSFIKIKDKTAIPYGTYEIVYNFSNRFKRNLPRLLDVPNFDGILIHSGNTKNDTSGCLLVGLKKGKNSILQSRNALNGIIIPLIKKYLGKEKIFIEITKR